MNTTNFDGFFEEKEFKTDIEKRNGLPLPPLELIKNDEDVLPDNSDWIYTCPKCGGKMYISSKNNLPNNYIICAKCHYTISSMNNESKDIILND